MAQRIFAYINEGVVKNLCVDDDYEVSNYLARSIYGPTSISVEIANTPVHIGDTYCQGYFKRIDEDGTEQIIEIQPSAEKQLEILNQKLRYLMMVQDVEVI